MRPSYKAAPKSNKVTVWVWERDTPLIGVGIKGTPTTKTGHAALQTYGENAFYASFYGEDGNQPGSDVKAVLQSIEVDMNMSQDTGHPFKRAIGFNLFTLDAQKMKDFFWSWLKTSVPEEDKEFIELLHFSGGNAKKKYRSYEQQLAIRHYEEKTDKKFEPPSVINLDFAKLKYNGLMGSSCLVSDTMERLNCAGLVAKLLRVGGVESLLKNYGSLTYTLKRASLFGLGTGAVAAGAVGLFGGPIAWGAMGAIGFSGGFAGAALQNGTDSVEGFNLALTPDGILRLVKCAKYEEIKLGYQEDASKSQSLNTSDYCEEQHENSSSTPIPQ